MCITCAGLRRAPVGRALRADDGRGERHVRAPRAVAAAGPRLHQLRRRRLAIYRPPVVLRVRHQMAPAGLVVGANPAGHAGVYDGKDRLCGQVILVDPRGACAELDGLEARPPLRDDFARQEEVGDRHDAPGHQARHCDVHSPCLGERDGQLDGLSGGGYGPGCSWKVLPYRGEDIARQLEIRIFATTSEKTKNNIRT